jgi:hypothetical protein
MKHHADLIRAAALLSHYALCTALETNGNNDSCSLDHSTDVSFQSFRSNPELKAPRLCINSTKGISDGYVFLGIDGNPDSEMNRPTIIGM